MNPLVVRKKALLGECLHFNYLKNQKPFLINGFDLTPELFGRSLDTYFSFSKIF